MIIMSIRDKEANEDCEPAEAVIRVRTAYRLGVRAFCLLLLTISIAAPLFYFTDLHADYFHTHSASHEIE